MLTTPLGYFIYMSAVVIEQLEYSSISHAYQNFNLCPHCIGQGRESLLCRMCEGCPMISRPDGSTFHLLLADHSWLYPAERNSQATKPVSLCFWYSHVGNGSETLASVVVLPDSEWDYAPFFRTSEYVADLLTEKLPDYPKLATLYKFENDKLFEAMY
jgi:hypothetical protein